MKEKYLATYMNVAKLFAAHSSAKRLQVGAVIARDDRILSVGYNGMPSGWDNECETEIYDNYGGKALITKPEVLHAEANAICKLARSNESGENAYLFLTHAPCIECAKMIYASGISNVIYDSPYRSTEGIDFLRQCKGVKIWKIADSS